MEIRKRCQAAGAVVGEAQSDGAAVLGVALAFDEPRRFCPVDEADGAVVLEEEVAGDIADRRGSRTRVAHDRKQQLVLGWGEVLRAGLLFAPAQKASQARAELQQALIFGFCGLAWHLVARYCGSARGRGANR